MNTEHMVPYVRYKYGAYIPINPALRSVIGSGQSPERVKSLVNVHCWQGQGHVKDTEALELREIGKAIACTALAQEKCRSFPWESESECPGT